MNKKFVYQVGNNKKDILNWYMFRHRGAIFMNFLEQRNTSLTR